MSGEVETAADPAETWEGGARVRLDRPDNPSHPRRWAIGEVLSARWFDPVHRWRYDRETRTRREDLLHPGCWLVRVRFPPQADAWDGCGGEWSLFGHELTRMEAEHGAGT